MIKKRTKQKPATGAPEPGAVKPGAVKPETYFWNSFILGCGLVYHALFSFSELAKQETEILCYIAHHGNNAKDVGPALIAERLRISRQTMTGILDKLEKQKYLRRMVHPTDRRRWFLKLTDKGNRFVSCFRERVFQAILPVKSSVTREAFFHTEHVLTEISETLLKSRPEEFSPEILEQVRNRMKNMYLNSQPEN